MLEYMNCRKSKLLQHRQAGTGVDPHGIYAEFIVKDVVKNIDVHI